MKFRVLDQFQVKAALVVSLFRLFGFPVSSCRQVSECLTEDDFRCCAEFESAFVNKEMCLWQPVTTATTEAVSVATDKSSGTGIPHIDNIDALKTTEFEAESMNQESQGNLDETSIKIKSSQTHPHSNNSLESNLTLTNSTLCDASQSSCITNGTTTTSLEPVSTSLDPHSNSISTSTTSIATTASAQSSSSVTSNIPAEGAKQKLKTRFNYASVDCGALVRAANPGAVSASSILYNSKDQYMLNECGVDQKYIELELCEEILVDSLLLANYEFFSSVFREFKVYGTEKYPPESQSDWELVGAFVAKNQRDLQAFEVESPVIWSRYLRIEFVSHYGHEFYCPLSVIKIFGKSMIEDFKEAEKEEFIEAIPESPSIIVMAPALTESPTLQITVQIGSIDTSNSEVASLSTKSVVQHSSQIGATNVVSQTQLAITSLQISDNITLSSLAASKSISEDSGQNNSNQRAIASIASSADQLNKVGADNSSASSSTIIIPYYPKPLASKSDNFHVIQSATSIAEASSATQSSLNSTKSSTSVTQPVSQTNSIYSSKPSGSGSRDSVFKNIIKRVTVLEKNVSYVLSAYNMLNLTDFVQTLHREQNVLLHERFKECESHLNEQVNNLILQQTKRVDDLVSTIEAQSNIIDQKTKELEQLIETNSRVSQWIALTNVPIILAVFVAKYFFERIAQAFHRDIILLPKHSQTPLTHHVKLDTQNPPSEIQFKAIASNTPSAEIGQFVTPNRAKKKPLKKRRHSH